MLAGGHGRLYTVFDATEVLNADGQLLGTWHPPFAYRRIKAKVRRFSRTLAISEGIRRICCTMTMV
jgi:hypothetical protein